MDDLNKALEDGNAGAAADALNVLSAGYTEKYVLLSDSPHFFLGAELKHAAVHCSGCSGERPLMKISREKEEHRGDEQLRQTSR